MGGGELGDRRRTARPSIDNASAPPTVPIRTAAPPNARSDCSGPETTNAPGPSPNSSASPAGATATRSTAAPTPPARHASASATARPPSATSWAERSAPARTRLADRGVQRAQLAEVGLRQLAERRLAAQLRELGAGRRRRPRAGGDDRDDVALLREAEAARARGLRQLADQPDDRRREDRARRRPRCRARRCRRRPGSRARGRRRRGRRPRARAARRRAASRGCRS